LLVYVRVVKASLFSRSFVMIGMGLFLVTGVVDADGPSLIEHTFEDIAAKARIPEGWHVNRDEEEGVVVYQVSRERPGSSGEYLAGFTLSMTPDVPGRAGMKPGLYAEDLLSFAIEDGGGEIVKGGEAPWSTFRAEYSIEGISGDLRILDYAVANDETGTLYFLAWQAPGSEAEDLNATREAVIRSLEFDPKK
jgi:hypothetical protein